MRVITETWKGGKAESRTRGETMLQKNIRRLLRVGQYDM